MKWFSKLENYFGSKRLALVCVVGALLPLLLLIALLCKFAVNVPFWDQWELVTLFQKFDNHTLGFADFFAQHNEHRILFPRLLMFGMAELTGWNIFYEIGANVVLAVVTFFFLIKILAKTFQDKKVLVAAIISASLLFFSPLQWENWMWGWQIQWFMNILGLVVAVWALTVWEHRNVLLRVLVAAAAATLATYSLASGMFVWLVVLPVFFVRKEFRSLIPLWIVLALVVVGSHYIHYVNPAYHPSKTLFMHEPIKYILYCLVYIGRPLSSTLLLSPQVACMVLGMGLVAAGYIFSSKRAWFRSNLLPWICLGAYGVFAALSTGISRLGFGLEQAYSNRYVTLSNFLVLAVLVGLFKLWELKKVTKSVHVLAMLFVSTLVILTINNYRHGVAQAHGQHDHLVKVQRCVQEAETPDDLCLLLAYPNQKIAWERLQYLRTIGWR